MKKGIVEGHILINHAASNINRDRNNSPKVMYFGGVQRGRESSQCWKKNVRENVRDELALLPMEDIMGSRTRNMPNHVWDIMETSGISSDYKDGVIKKLCLLGKTAEKNIKSGKDNNDNGKENEKTTLAKIIMFYSLEELEAVANLLISLINESGSVEAFEKITQKVFEAKIKDLNLRPVSLDIALFGRMMSVVGFKTVESSTQVAHSFSTHKVNTETDFFTACDDEIDSGSAHLEDSEFNSCCYYKYFNIDIGQLIKNLEYAPDAEEIVKNTIGIIIQAFIKTRPKAKQHPYASFPMPAAVVVELKDKKIPLSYADAFVTPVSPKKDSNLIEGSVKALLDHIKKCDEGYDIEKKRFLYDFTKCNIELGNTTSYNNLDRMIEAVTDDIIG